MRVKAKPGRKTEVVRVFTDTADLMREIKTKFRVPMIHLFDRAVSAWIDSGPTFDLPYGVTTEDKAEMRAKGRTK